MIRRLLDRLLKRGPTFEARRGPSGQWYVRELAPNGEIVSVSETYTRRSSAVRAARTRAGGAINGRWRVA